MFMESCILCNKSPVCSWKCSRKEPATFWMYQCSIASTLTPDNKDKHPTFLNAWRNFSNASQNSSLSLFHEKRELFVAFFHFPLPLFWLVAATNLPFCHSDRVTHPAANDKDSRTASPENSWPAALRFKPDDSSFNRCLVITKVTGIP